MKKINITLAEFIEALASQDEETNGKRIESLGVDSRDNLVVLFTDRSEVKISRRV